MAKSNRREHQLSLFDIFDNLNNNTDGKQQPSDGTTDFDSKGDEQQELRNTPGRGEQVDIRSGAISSGDQNIRSDEANPTGAPGDNEGGRNAESIPDEVRKPVLGQVLPDSNREQGNQHADENAAEQQSRRRDIPTDIGSSTNLLKNYSATYDAQKNKTNKTFSKPEAYQDNITALQTIVKINEQKRRATPAEQAVIAKYRGFGGLKEILLDPSNPSLWSATENATRNRIETINSLLEQLAALNNANKDEYLNSLKRSILNAHYTPDAFISAIHQIIERIGFNGGNILEPSAGSGKFITLLPEHIANQSQTTAIEIDKLTGELLQKLLPQTQIHIKAFEKTILPNNSFDLVISNVPYAEIGIYDPILNRYSDKRFNEASSDNLHNFFIAKSILLAKPNALLCFITSRYTMDSSQNPAIREIIGDYCTVLSALRLPESAFRNEAGTDVVADILFLQKRETPILNNIDNPIKATQEISLLNKNSVQQNVSINEYFINHPENIIGKNSIEGGMYRENNYTVISDNDDLDWISQQIISITNKDIPLPIYQKQAPSTTAQKVEADERRFKNILSIETPGNIVQLEDGFIGRISYETFSEQGEDGDDIIHHYINPIKIAKPDINTVRDFIKIRNSIKDLLNDEIASVSDLILDNKRTELLRNYNSFRSRHGIIAKNKSILKKYTDPDLPLVESLEIVDAETKIVKLADCFYGRTITSTQIIDQADNLQDAINLSINKYGRLNIGYICGLRNTSIEKIFEEQLRNNQFLIFQTPDGTYETAEEYLSGNILDKITSVKPLAIEDERYRINLIELEKVIPAKIKAGDIYAPIHAVWIPKDHIVEFIKTLTDNTYFSFDLQYNKAQDEYNFRTINNSEVALEKYATSRKKPKWVLEHFLNGTDPLVKYTITDASGNTKTEVDKQDTFLAKEKIKQLTILWDNFKYAEIKRRSELEDIYNKTYNNTRLRNFEGKGQNTIFPGLVGYVPNPHQKDAVCRNIQTLGGINDHIVGSGKTLIQIMTVMELRRLNMAAKPMIIGLKAQIPSLYNQFKKAYPFAKVLYPADKDFEKHNRQKLLFSIATNDWDCVILSHDQFGKIPPDPIIQEKTFEDLIQELKNEITGTTDRIQLKQMEKKLYAYEQKLEELADMDKDKNVLDFRQLGVDFLIVDESQEFKNLEFVSKLTNVTGLGNRNGSKKALNMLIACRSIQDRRGAEQGILFASGTPISNSISELYLLFKYLIPEKLERTGLNSFDKWTGNFASIYTDLEYYLGKYKIVNRIREFKNLPELITMYREIADVRNDANLTIDKPKANHNLIKILPTDEQTVYIDMLYKFVTTHGNDFKNELGLTAGYDDHAGKNPSASLLAIGMAKKLSLDPRLINDSISPGAKLDTAADSIKQIFLDTEHFKGTQLVFCDISTPKSKNQIDNLYELISSNGQEEFGFNVISAEELISLFGEDYYARQSKPKINDLKTKLTSILEITEDHFAEMVDFANQEFSDFNAYEHLKTLLIKKGIPQDQIAFIHDYNTKPQKEKIYELMNSGEKRILFGSTQRLGTGTNVQYRLSAIHHLDINWKPAQLIQRNGRGERQGNWGAKTHLDNQIPIYYYATERTFDSYMYNLNAVKNRFINQIKIQDFSIRESKDLTEEIELSTMGAELSGNPIVKEKTQLEKRIYELNSLKKSHDNSNYDAQATIRSNEKMMKFYADSEAKYTRLLNHYKTLPINNETGLREDIFVINGASYAKPGEAGKAVLERQASLAKNTAFSSGKFTSIGTINGYYINVDSATMLVSFHLSDPVTNEQIGAVRNLSTSDVGAAIQIKNTFYSAEEVLADINHRRDNQVTSMQAAETKLNEKFVYEDELNKAIERLSAINLQIDTELKELNKSKPDEKQQEIQNLDSNEVNEQKINYS